MREHAIAVESPLYLVIGQITCWRCGAEMMATGLVAPNVPEAGREVCSLSNIEELPAWLVNAINERCPTFKLTYSKTVGGRYYANTCPECGMLSGDFYLHSEPGGPFFPTTEEEARSLTIEQIALPKTIYVRATIGMGIGDLILDHARKVGAEQGDATDDASRRR